MPKARKPFARMAFVVLIGFVVIALVQRVRRVLIPLGESPPIEFPAVSISQSEVQQFLDGDFRLIKDMKALPEPLIKAFTETGGSRLTMANPGKEFQATDLILYPSVPQRRLVFAGVSGERCFILYEQGGIAHFYVLALFKLSPASAMKPIWEGSCEPAADIAELRSKVSKGLCSQPIPLRWVLHVWDH